MDFKKFVALKEADGDVESLAPLKQQGTASDKGRSEKEVSDAKSRLYSNPKVENSITDKIQEYFTAISGNDDELSKKIKNLGLNLGTGARGLAKFYIDILYKMMFDEKGNMYDFRDRQQAGVGIANTFRQMSKFNQTLFAIVNTILRDKDVNERDLVSFIDKLYEIQQEFDTKSVSHIYQKKNSTEDSMNDYTDEPKFDRQELIDDIIDYTTNPKNSGQSTSETGMPLDLVADTVMGMENVKPEEDLEIVKTHFPRLKSIGKRFISDEHKEKLYNLAIAIIDNMRHSENLSSDGGYTTTINNINAAALSQLTDFLKTEKINPTEARYILEIISKYGGNDAIYAGSNTSEGGDKGNILSMVVDNITKQYGADKWTKKIRPDLEKKLGFKFDKEQMGTAHGANSRNPNKDTKGSILDSGTFKQLIDNISDTNVGSIAQAAKGAGLPEFFNLTPDQEKTLSDAIESRFKVSDLVVPGKGSGPLSALKYIRKFTGNDTVGNTNTRASRDKTRANKFSADRSAAEKAKKAEDEEENETINSSRSYRYDNYINETLDYESIV